MPDLMTAHGRSVMLRRLEPHWRDLEDGVERRAMSVYDALRDLDRPNWIKIGGGVLVVASLAAAFQMLMRPRTVPEKAAPRPAHRRASRRPAAKPVPAKRPNGRATA